jgi:dTDP-glucose 4,6-dehydratase
VKIVVTGGAGFIGSTLVHMLLADGECDVVVLDALTYAGNLENLRGLDANPRYRFVRGSICDEVVVEEVVAGCDAIVNVAAETHVDRSIDDPRTFLETNVQGPRVLLDAARSRRCRYLQVSTDEVYGDLPTGVIATEDSPLAPSSPYAASKAAADLLVAAYRRTYGVDALITRCGNNYGPRQFPEKLVPLFITNALEDRELPLYGDGLNVRDWIHVDDHCRGIVAVLKQGETGRIYNISAECTLTNRDVCSRILAALAKPATLVRPVADRPGHDRRYALDPSRIREELGWTPIVGLDGGLASTVAWYRENRAWWENVKSGEYTRVYAKLYGTRLKSSRSAGHTGKIRK